MKNVKKIIISTVSILVVTAISFFCGYSIGGNQFDDSRIDRDTDLIREQAVTIKSLEGRLRGAIGKSNLIIEEGNAIEAGLDKLGAGLGDIEEGLSEDIEGVSGVIKRLKYYREQGELLEKNITD